MAASLIRYTLWLTEYGQRDFLSLCAQNPCDAMHGATTRPVFGLSVVLAGSGKVTMKMCNVVIQKGSFVAVKTSKFIQDSINWHMLS
jgi:hypothetical protein